MTTAPAPGRRRSGPSIGDVARLAGVSPQTVSRVSTGADSVRPSTRARVVQAMDQLGYSPNRAAQALRNGTFGAIGVLSTGFQRTGEALTAEALVEAAALEDYSVTLLHVRNPARESWDNAAHRISHQAIDGLVIMRAEQASPTTLALPAGMPVAVSFSKFAGHYPTVTADQVQGSEDAVRHLLDLGHRTVHHLAGPRDSEHALVRSGTWRRCLLEAGIRPPEPVYGDWSAHDGYEAGLRLAADPDVTAVFCANDEMALGLVRALHETGRRVPDDVSVVGFDDIAVAGWTSPPLTTVRQDFHAIGRALITLVVGQLPVKVRPTAGPDCRPHGAHRPGEHRTAPTLSLDVEVTWNLSPEQRDAYNQVLGAANRELNSFRRPLFGPLTGPGDPSWRVVLTGIVEDVLDEIVEPARRWRWWRVRRATSVR